LANPLSPPVYPEDLHIVEVAAEAHEQLRVEAFHDGQPSLMLDEHAGFSDGAPMRLAGQSRGWTPVGAHMAALSASLAVSAKLRASQNHIGFDSLRIHAAAIYDPSLVYDADTSLLPYAQVVVDVYMESDASDHELADLAAIAVRMCPQQKLLRLADVPSLIRWHGGGSLTPLVEQRWLLPDGRQTPEEALRAMKA
jgi:uncharacterized OsmC-like protein